MHVATLQVHALCSFVPVSSIWSPPVFENEVFVCITLLII